MPVVNGKGDFYDVNINKNKVGEAYNSKSTTETFEPIPFHIA